jgi:nucleotide-binding universal stress UspA family protein
VEHHVHADRVGDVGASIVRHAAEIGTDLIAITTHGAGGVKRVLFGSIAQQVLARCPVPVLLVTSHYAAGRGSGNIGTFLVPVDLDPAHAPAVDLALALAHPCRARVTCLGVAATSGSLTGNRSAAAQVQPAATAALLDAERRQYGQRMRQIQGSAAATGVPVEVVMESGPAAARILERIDRTTPDLVIVSSHRRRGLDAAITGSVGQQLCNRSTSPLLIVPI